jgi:hypothetical protein
MVRQVINFKQLAVTPMKIEIPRIAKKKVLSAAWTSAGEEKEQSLRAARALSRGRPPAAAVCAAPRPFCAAAACRAPGPTMPGPVARD